MHFRKMPGLRNRIDVLLRNLVQGERSAGYSSTSSVSLAGFMNRIALSRVIVRYDWIERSPAHKLFPTWWKPTRISLVHDSVMLIPGKGTAASHSDQGT